MEEARLAAVRSYTWSRKANPSRSSVALSALVLILASAPGTAPAQAYPSRIVRVVIPWPGGTNDAAGRIVFQKVAESLGQPFVIENRAGAASTIGTALVAKGAPDG